MKRVFYAFLVGIVVFISSCKQPEIPVIVQEEFKPVVAPSIVWDGKTKKADITYQLLVYSFADSDNDGTGDFNGITANLDYINSLGADAIWLSPIHPCDSYHGYDVKDYSAVNPKFGTEEDFKNLVNEAHKRGIKIYLDYVMNHTSSNHPWFLDAKKSPESPYRDYYIFSKDPASDIAEGKIAMIRTQGSAGYNAAEWFALESETKGRYKFVLDWGATPKVTVTETTTVDPDVTTVSADDKYLYYGNGFCKRFKKVSDNKFELSVDFESSWGFLIRTSNSTWDNGTKYGSPSSSQTLALGQPFELSNSGDVQNIVFAGGEYFHSHFNTGSFADLNYGPASEAENSPAFKALVASAKKWVDLGVDGLRLDAVKHIYHNAAGTENPLFLKKFYEEMNGYYRQNHNEDFYMVGEVFTSADAVAPYYAGLPALFEFSYWWKLSDVLNNPANARYFAKDILAFQPSYANYRKDYIEATKLSNHDEERTCTTLGGSVDKAAMAGAMLLTSGGHPYIYYGEELGLTGSTSGGDINVRQNFDWTKQKSLKNDKSSILNLYSDFAAVRNTNEALAVGQMSEHSVFNSGNSSYPTLAVWYMTSESQKALVIHNVGTSSVQIDLKDEVVKTLIVKGNVTERDFYGTRQLTLDKYSSIVFEVKK